MGIMLAEGPSQTAGLAVCEFFCTLKKCKMNKKNILSIITLVAAFTVEAQTQGKGMAGINDATTMVTSYFDPLTRLIFAVAAVLGLVGGVRVYSKFSSGDPDASKSATALFLSCVFLVIVGTVLRSFFL